MILSCLFFPKILHKNVNCKISITRSKIYTAIMVKFFTLIIVILIFGQNIKKELNYKTRRICFLNNSSSHL